MSDLIDRHAAIEKIESHKRTAEEPYNLNDYDNAFNWAIEVACSCLAHMPSAESRPKAEWVPGRYTMQCSKCNEICDKIYLNDYNFCPNCGAWMRGRE